MNYLQNFGHRAQYKNQIQDTLLNQYCLLKNLESSKATTKKHLSTWYYYKFTQTIRNWHPISSIYLEKNYMKKLHSAHFFFLLLSSRLITEHMQILLV